MLLRDRSPFLLRVPAPDIRFPSRQTLGSFTLQPTYDRRKMFKSLKASSVFPFLVHVKAAAGLHHAHCCRQQLLFELLQGQMPDVTATEPHRATARRPLRWQQSLLDPMRRGLASVRQDLAKAKGRLRHTIKYLQQLPPSTFSKKL